MKLYKIVNGDIEQYDSGFVVLENRIYTNPTEEHLKQAGYKPLCEDEMPEYDVENQYLERVIEDTPEAILVHWEVKEKELLEDVKTEKL